MGLFLSKETQLVSVEATGPLSETPAPDSVPRVLLCLLLLTQETPEQTGQWRG